MEDDECVDPDDDDDSKKKKKQVAEPVKTTRESPVRRLAQKTPASCEDVLFLGMKQSKEKEELDGVMEKTKLLQIARSES